MNWLDFTGASLSLLCTYYFTQARRTAWLLGILATILNSVLYWQKGLYGAVVLDSIYFFTMIAGWYHWSGSNTSQPSKLIRPLRTREFFLFSVIAFLGIFIVAFLLATFAHSDVPYWDATTTVLSLMAQWLLCLKILHCWILWFIVDALTALLQLYKGIPFHSAIHWLYLIMAVLGYYRWKKLYQDQYPITSIQPDYAVSVQH